MRSVTGDSPKVMADIAGRPFLDILIKYYASFGIKRFILCVGYRSDFIKEYYSKVKTSLDLVYSQEEKPLGTGGALKKAAGLIGSDTFLVSNADTLCKVDIVKLFEFHRLKKSRLSIVLIMKKDNIGCGLVKIDNDSKIVEFKEKAVGNPKSLISAGIYMMDKSVFKYMPSDDSFSLENDLFPKLAAGESYGFFNDLPLVDIGIPEKYAKVKLQLKDCL